jgi:hypothetical protein
MPEELLGRFQVAGHVEDALAGGMPRLGVVTCSPISVPETDLPRVLCIGLVTRLEPLPPRQRTLSTRPRGHTATARPV